MPLPNDFVLPKPQAKEYLPFPADIYQCEITDIEYKVEPNRYKKEPSDPDMKQLMNFEFTIIEDGPYYGRKVWVKMTPIAPLPSKNNKPSWIWRIASALAGHPITKEEGEKYTTADINGFIHRQIRVNIVQALGKDGKTYNNADGFLPAKVQLPPFDEAKISEDTSDNEPDESPVAETPEQPQTGYDKAKQVANSLSGANPASAPASNEGNIEDIPF
jgi:hypothetical protein